MSHIPPELKYTQTHEWIRPHEDGTVSIGITDRAQALMGDMVFVELPEVGRRLTPGEACAVVESVKSASDIYSPVSGRVTATNTVLTDAPETINQDPYGEGWLFCLQPSDSLDQLLDAAAYSKLTAAAE